MEPPNSQTLVITGVTVGGVTIGQITVIVRPNEFAGNSGRWRAWKWVRGLIDTTCDIFRVKP